MFLKISSLSHSIVFLYFFALITEEGFLSLLAILWNSAFKWVYLFFSPLPLASILFSVICKTSSDNHFAFFPYAPVNHKSSYLPISFLLHALVHFFFPSVEDSYLFSCLSLTVLFPLPGICVNFYLKFSDTELSPNRF